MKALSITLLLLLAMVACSPEAAQKAQPAVAEAATEPEPAADDTASLAWPQSLHASGTTTQTASEDPPPGGDPAPVIVPTTNGALRYDWPSRTMSTHYAPACPSLLTAVSGSQDYGCSYFFQDDNVYYVYQDQQMTAEPPTEEASCCVINGFSMLSFRFPEYVEQYDDYMADVHQAPCQPSMLPQDPRLPTSAVTPGTPGAGFYAYDPTMILSHGEETWVTPLGFGGNTPNSAFTEAHFDQAIAFPADIAELALPEICRQQDVPQCMNCDSSGNCSGSLTELLGYLNSPKVAGCVLCHSKYETPQFPPALLTRFSANSCGGPPTGADGEDEVVARR